MYYDFRLAAFYSIFQERQDNQSDETQKFVEKKSLSSWKSCEIYSTHNPDEFPQCVCRVELKSFGTRATKLSLKYLIGLTYCGLHSDKSICSVFHQSVSNLLYDIPRMARMFDK